jgi:hypothetical protein
MKRLIPALLSALVLSPGSAGADNAQPGGQGCGVVSGLLISQGEGQVMINCVGVTEAYGQKLAGVLTYVLQNRLDPEIVITKLSEIEGAPENGIARSLSVEQDQALLHILMGKPGETITIAANPKEKDSGEYALAIATQLQMVGWQVDGNQISRATPAGFEDVPGLAMIVRDEKAPPEKAQRLKAAFAAAKLFLPIVADASLPPERAVLWIGKRPGPASATVTQ